MNQLIESVLFHYDISKNHDLKQIHKNAWSVNNQYILKKNNDLNKLKKSIFVNRSLISEKVPVAEYVESYSGSLFVEHNGEFYSLMHKLCGSHLDKNISDCMAFYIGTQVAELHKAFNKLKDSAELTNSDLIEDLHTWILLEINKKSIWVSEQIIKECLAFKCTYDLLPRQQIHRDLHLGNMLFDNGKLSGFLDFDISHINARLFDIAYFGLSILSDSYKDEEGVAKWTDFFNNFLQGYHSENNLTEIEIQSIHMMCVIIELLFTAYFSSIELEELVPNCVDMLHWIYNNRPIFCFSL